MRKTFVTVVLLICAFAIQAQKQRLQVANFNELDIYGAMEVELKQGNSTSVEIEMIRGDLNDIDYGVDNGELKVGPKRGRRNIKAKLYITVQQLESIELSGAVDVAAQGVFKSKELDIDTSGASAIRMEVDVEELSLDASGASNFRLSGKAGGLDVDFSGASELKAMDLQVQYATIDASGSCDIDVWVMKKLRADISGSCDIRYKGDANMSVSASGSAEVIHID